MTPALGRVKLIVELKADVRPLLSVSVDKPHKPNTVFIGPEVVLLLATNWAL
mgnify:CR=1 FL=1